METIIKGRGSGIEFVLVDEKKYFLLEKLGWMTSHASWLDRYWTKVSKARRREMSFMKKTVAYRTQKYEV